MLEDSLNSIFLVLLDQGHPIGPDGVHARISPLVPSLVLNVVSLKRHFVFFCSF